MQEKDTRPIWQRYTITFDWPVVAGAVALGIIGAASRLLGG